MILYILIRHVQVQRSLQKPTEAYDRFILRFSLQDESESFASTKTTEPTAYLDNKRNVCKEVEGSHGYPSLQSLITLGPRFFVGTCRWWVISNMLVDGNRTISQFLSYGAGWNWWNSAHFWDSQSWTVAIARDLPIAMGEYCLPKTQDSDENGFTCACWKSDCLVVTPSPNRWRARIEKMVVSRILFASFFLVFLGLL